ncbi:MAG: peptidylprolyl isomerase [Phycisphaerae bacterium]|nr:peptidylprolyl isomerase [Phycisphaerae bacterium]
MNYVICLTLMTQGGAFGAAGVTSTQPVTGAAALKHVKAILSTDRTHLHTSEPVWVDFLLRNDSDQSVVLTVPEADVASMQNAAMGLPFDHVFSGEKFRALSIVDGQGAETGREVMYRPVGPVPAVTLAPNGLVGIRIDVGQYYPALRRSGLFLFTWRPYGGALESNELRIELAPHKEVVLITNLGKIRLKLLYEKAPNHVANFIELIEKGYYNRTRFFRIYSGVAALGGDRLNDGTGMREDGKTLKAELNDTPFDEGTVGMSLSGDDPDSGSSQFFICMRRIKPWDGKYTAFAQAIGQESLETLGKMSEVEVDDQDRPLRNVVIERVDIETVRKSSSQEEITIRRP